VGAGFQYHAYEPAHAWVSPVRAALRGLKLAFDMPFNPMGKTLWGRQSSEACKMFEELTRWYVKPELGIKDVQIEDKMVPVSENVVLSKDFGGLLHFTRNAPTLRTAASGPFWRL
jgi:poly(3-hydroxybutyrate) depolymerase